jgi:hypothetical protein
MSEANFVGGMRVTRHEKAPEFVLASIGVNIEDFIAWADKHSKNGWVNFQLLKSKEGKPYAVLDTFEKSEAPVKKVEKKEDVIEYPEEDTSSIDTDIPF